MRRSIRVGTRRGAVGPHSERAEGHNRQRVGKRTGQADRRLLGATRANDSLRFPDPPEQRARTSPRSRTDLNGCVCPASIYGLEGREHAGGSVGGLPRTRRRSIHDSQNLSRAPAASLRDRLRRPWTEPVCRQVRQQSGSGEGPGQGRARSRRRETSEMETRTSG